MSGPFKPIDPGFVNGVQFNADQAHGPYPDHMDTRIKFDDLGGVCQKLRIDTTGNILSDELELGNRFFKDLMD